MAPGQAVRMAAGAAISGILATGKTVDERLSADRAVETFGPRDAALMRSIIVAAMRRLGTIRLVLDRFIEKRPPRKAQALEGILIAAVAQILFLDVPDHPAVDLAVRAAKHDSATAPYAALTNGVLRNVIRHRDELLAMEEPFADTPAWLVARWTAAWGQEAAEKIALSHRQEPTFDLTVRGDPQDWADRLGGVVLPTGAVRLRDRTPVEEIEGYADGQWWVQDAAAALPARLLDPQPGEWIADLCAAPGGKTAQLAAAEAKVVAVDRSAERLKRLGENLRRLKLEADVRASDALAFHGGPFDAILLDAPCTGTGTIRRHPEIAWNKRQGDLTALTSLQSKLLDRAVTLLRPGGRLVYSTCSIEPEEGEHQIAALLRRNPDMRRAPVSPEEVAVQGGPEASASLTNWITGDGDVRILPYFLHHDLSRLSGIDGFFMARLTRIR
ncbi:MAG: methyltransferase domain-containing protein [Hyphomicrobiales bacterium]|nr:methyltransferase domain-containing protein [Hyphomicrobiales bacterium]